MFSISARAISKVQQSMYAYSIFHLYRIIYGCQIFSTYETNIGDQAGNCSLLYYVFDNARELSHVQKNMYFNSVFHLLPF